MSETPSPETKGRRAPAFARTDAGGDKAAASASPEIKDFDKGQLFQQIVQADNAAEIADLEARVELIDAIQRASLLQTLPQTALYFLERELSLSRAETGAYAGDGIRLAKCAVRGKQTL